MLDRRSLMTNGGAAALGTLALAAVASGTAAAGAAPAGHNPWVPLPDPATTPVPNPPFPTGLTREERRNLETFSELDFDVFTHEKKYAVNIATIGLWNKRGTMDEEFLFWDNQAISRQIGLA